MITISSDNKLKYVIAIDLGGTFIKSAIVDSNGKIHKTFKTDTFAKVSPKKVTQQIEKSIGTLNKGFKKDISGIGIGAPGVVFDGKVHYPPNFKNWKIIDLKKHFSSKYRLKTEIDNDANCAALAELNFGQGKKYKSFLFLTLGTGIGGGIVLDGKLYRGERNGAGEFGMMTINYNGPVCKGGNQGSIESHIGRNYFLKNEKSEIKKLGKNIDFEDISKLASKGNEAAKELMKKYGFYLGVAITNYLNLMDARIVILSGGISNTYKYFITECNKTIKEKSLPTIRNNFKILKSNINNDAGVLGAASLILFNSN